MWRSSFLPITHFEADALLILISIRSIALHNSCGRLEALESEKGRNLRLFFTARPCFASAFRHGVAAN